MQVYRKASSFTFELHFIFISFFIRTRLSAAVERPPIKCILEVRS